jgi:hypothetical protein
MSVISTGKKNTKPTFILDEYEIHEVPNVKSINFHHTLFDSTFDFGWDVEVEENINKEENANYERYFYCETLFEDAFGHWIFESAIYIPLYWKLKQKYPNLKWLIHKKKKYKEMVLKGACFQSDDIKYSIDTPNNSVFFPFYTSHHDLSITSSYKVKLIKFRNFFYSLVGPIEKTVDYLYLPRGTAENFNLNDRLIMCQPELIEYFSKKQNSNILYTDNEDNFLNQIRKVLSAKKIILDYGSSFIVNSFFAKNCEIICIGHNVHHEIQTAQQMIIECINENNTTFEFIHKLSQEGDMPIKQNYSLEKIYSKIEEKSLKN